MVGLKGVTDRYDIMLMTKNGIIIRSDVGRISVMGRNTQGVRLISLAENDKVVDIALCEKQPDLEPLGQSAAPKDASHPEASENKETEAQPENDGPQAG